MKRSVTLIVLDGWGIGSQDQSNPLTEAHLETLPYLAQNFPITSLEASGINVGLPWGETGNSEVGHLTMGAGKVLYQHYPRITLTIRNGSFFTNPVLKAAFDHARKYQSTVNFVGLLTKGNTHASIEHLKALLEMAQKEKYDNVKMHLFADGVDSSPHSIDGLLNMIPKEKIATLTGRYYAMDRNRNWNLTKNAYDILTENGGMKTPDATQAIQATYAREPSEEYLPPLRLMDNSAIQENDAIVFFNFREDSIRQIAEAFIEKPFTQFAAKQFNNLYITTFTRYEEKFTCPVVFPPDIVQKPLGAVLSERGLNQMRIAETHKYAHITYFFNGFREAPFKNEYRVLIPSLKGVHPSDHPEMMAPALTDRLVEALNNRAFDFILINYANPDAIAHTGNFEAGKKAAEIIDKELGKVIKAAAQVGSVVIITSDHGNIERMLDPTTGRPETQHDPNPVPFYLIHEDFRGRKFYNYNNLKIETAGGLADIAPTILNILDIPVPADMSGQNLLRSLL